MKTKVLIPLVISIISKLSFSQTTLKGSVSKGFRSPSIRELYLWAPANEELEPERMINYEVNYDYPMPGITFFGGINFHFERRQTNPD